MSFLIKILPSKPLIKYFLSKERRKYFPIWVISKILYRLFGINGFLKLKIPWIVFDSIDYLNSISFENKSIFEWGSGGSTLFFIKKDANVISVEHNLDWYNLMLKFIPKNQAVSYIYTPKKETLVKKDAKNPFDYYSNIEPGDYKEYVTIINRYPDNYFDLILIDGRSRASCIFYSLKKIKIGGIIVVDDTYRDYYFDNMNEYLKNFKRIDFEGISPLNSHINRTTIFIKQIEMGNEPN